jgi:protein SCO1/2
MPISGGFMQRGRSSLGMLLAACAVAAIAAAGGIWLAKTLGRPPALVSGTLLERARPIAPFALRDEHDRPFANDRLTGAPSLLFFGFTNCPDLCPTTLATLADVLRAKPWPGLRVVFVTVDPERDSAPVLERYLNAFGPGFTGVTGPTSALDPLAHSLAAAYERVPLPDGGYMMDHSAAVYVIDPQGRFVAVFTPPFSTKQMTLDLESLGRRIGS